MTKAEVRQLMMEAFAAGFEASGEGYNGEWSAERRDTDTVYIGNITVPFSLVATAEEFVDQSLKRRKVR